LTSLLFEEYAPLLWRHGLPPAYVLQEPGVEYDHAWIPWGSTRALFIGGATNEFKLGPEVEAIVAEAHARGLWVHMGRVNSLRRLAYAASIGCDCKPTKPREHSPVPTPTRPSTRDTSPAAAVTPLEASHDASPVRRDPQHGSWARIPPPNTRPSRNPPRRHQPHAHPRSPTPIAPDHQAQGAEPMIFKVHVPGAPSYEIGDEIWQQPLDEAIRAEAQTIADHAGSDLLQSPDQAHRDQLREQIIAAMTNALVHVGDLYRAPDGVLYSLIDDPPIDAEGEQATIADMPADTPPTVEALSLGSCPQPQTSQLGSTHKDADAGVGMKVARAATAPAAS